MSPRGFGRHWADAHGHLATPSLMDERHPSAFPPALIEENLATIRRRKAELERLDHRPEQDAAE